MSINKIIIGDRPLITYAPRGRRGGVNLLIHGKAIAHKTGLKYIGGLFKWLCQLLVNLSLKLTF